MGVIKSIHHVLGTAFLRRKRLNISLIISITCNEAFLIISLLILSIPGDLFVFSFLMASLISSIVKSMFSVEFGLDVMSLLKTGSLLSELEEKSMLKYFSQTLPSLMATDSCFMFSSNSFQVSQKFCLAEFVYSFERQLFQNVCRF